MKPVFLPQSQVIASGKYRWETRIDPNGSIAFYVVSWLVFLVGIWLVGREYYDSIKKYTTLKFYHESVVEGTKKVAEQVLKKQ